MRFVIEDLYRGFDLRRTFCIGLIAALLTTTAASAADLGVRAPVPILTPVPAFSWTGFYAGITAGAAYDRYTFPFAAGYNPSGAYGGRGTIYSSGPIGGAQIGYKYQLPWGFLSNVVVGVEADAFGASISGRFNTAGALPLGPGFGSIGVSTRLDALGSIRGRIGYTFDRILWVDNVLAYFTAGANFAHIHNDAWSAAGPVYASYSRSYFRAGAPPKDGTYGIGIEKAINSQLSIQGEYRYVALGSGTNDIKTPAGAALLFGTRSMYHIGRVALNWKFGL